MRGGGPPAAGAGPSGGRELPAELIRLTDEDRRYLERLYDDSVPLPAGRRRAT